MRDYVDDNDYDADYDDIDNDILRYININFT